MDGSLQVVAPDALLFLQIWAGSGESNMLRDLTSITKTLVWWQAGIVYWVLTLHAASSRVPMGSAARAASSGCPLSSGQPLRNTYSSQAPAACEVMMAISTSVVKKAPLMMPAS